MDDNRKGIVSNPDENGIRYYTFGPPSGAPEGRSEARAEETGDSGSKNSFEQAPGEAVVLNGTGNGPGGPGVAGGGNDNGSRGNKRKSLKKPLLIFGCVLLAVVVLGAACSRMNANSGDNRYANISGDHISVLYIDGTIASDSTGGYGASTYNHEWTIDRLDDVIHNPNNKGLILFVNTPGGGVYETDEIYLKLKEYKETGRPLYSAMGSMAASGGYYISAPADKIIANRNCWTGSIGVTIGTIFDVSDLLDKYGIKTVTITSGKNKAMGSMVDPLTKEQQAIYQSLVDEAYEQFVGIVAEGRKLPAGQVKKLADGRVYTAKQALDNRLVDQIGTLDEAVLDMQEQYRLQDCKVYNMKYEHTGFFDSIFGKLAGAGIRDKGDVAALLEIMNDQGEAPISYMSEIRK